MNSNIKQYLKEVSAKLSCPKGVKSVFLRQLKSDILAIADNNITITVSELYSRFGTPEEIAAGFFDRDDYSVMLKMAKRRAAIWMFVSVILTILLIFAIYLVVKVNIDLGGNIEITKPHVYNKEG